MDLRNSIKFIYPMNSNKICFVSSRITIVEFDQKENNEAVDQLYPIKVDYDPLRQELIVATRRDLRFLDVNCGRTQKIFGGIIQSNEEEITCFLLYHQNKKFMVGTLKGSRPLPAQPLFNIPYLACSNSRHCNHRWVVWLRAFVWWALLPEVVLSGVIFTQY